MSQSPTISSQPSSATLEIIESLAAHARMKGLDMADNALMAMLEVLHSRAAKEKAQATSA
nr:hypothetical protein [Roseomonas sp. SXEYE001]